MGGNNGNFKIEFMNRPSVSHGAIWVWLTNSLNENDKLPENAWFNLMNEWENLFKTCSFENDRVIVGADAGVSFLEDYENSINNMNNVCFNFGVVKKKDWSPKLVTIEQTIKYICWKVALILVECCLWWTLVHFQLFKLLKYLKLSFFSRITNTCSTIYQSV